MRIKNDNKMSKGNKIALFVLSAVFIFSVANLAVIKYKDYLGDKTYKNIIKQAETAVALEKEGVKQPQAARKPENKEKEKTPQFVDRRAEVTALKQNYSDVVGWITLPNTKLDYPIVKGKNNDQYLNRAVDGTYTSYGSIFMDYRASGDFSDKNTVVYGHNMKGGAMFAALTKYKSQEFFDNNRVICIDTGDEKLEGLVLAAYTDKYDSDAYKTNFASDEEFRQYLKSITDKSLIDANIDTDSVSRIATFSTCTNVKEDDRFITQVALRSR